MPRGRLRIYLGMAPGVGKTYAMLAEGHRRAGRGTDVVIGFVEDYGRPLTRQMTEGLAAIPPRTVTSDRTTVNEMDLAALLARRPKVALVDEIAHTNAAGSRNKRRWQDIDDLLAAGIDVISTVDISHLESLNDVVEQITGVRQHETVPDQVIRKADQIELVDMSPEALRRRMAHGNIYPAEKIDATLANYFRVGNLTALRELALLWVADRVDEVLQQYRGEHGIQKPWPTRERVLVALSGGPEGTTLIRRGARIASRAAGGELLAVYVARSRELADASSKDLAELRSFVESLGGTYHVVLGDDAADAVLEFAQAVNATTIIVGASRRSRLRRALTRGVSAEIVERSGENLDVHVVTHEEAAGGRFVGGPRGVGSRAGLLSGRRVAAAWVLAIGGPWLLTAALMPVSSLNTLPIDLLLFLTLTVGVALVGGLWPALVAAVLGSLLVNFFFTSPAYRLGIDDPVNVVALVVFLVVAAAVSSVFDRATRKTAQAARARAEADTLSTLAGSILSGQDALPVVLRHAQQTFGMTSVALLERSEDDRGWRSIAFAGDDPCLTPDNADVAVPIAGRLTLALRGRTLPAEQHRVLTAFTAQASQLLERQRLREVAADAERLAESDRTRTALLAAVSRDLRTPLNRVQAAVTGLHRRDVGLTAEERTELLATIEQGTDQLDHLVANLLDMSRLQTNDVHPASQPVSLDQVVPAALAVVPGADKVRLDVPEGLPAVLADPALVQRVIANIVENAVKHTPPGTPVTVSASALRDHAELRVADRGPGVPDSDKERIFAPFRHQADTPAETGVGLGLAVARGFAEAMDGSLVAEDTPGGGLTMVLSLPSVDASRARARREKVAS
jgi:two-component system sensor histidine kinase KdpD